MTNGSLKLLLEVFEMFASLLWLTRAADISCEISFKYCPIGFFYQYLVSELEIFVKFINLLLLICLNVTHSAIISNVVYGHANVYERAARRRGTSAARRRGTSCQSSPFFNYWVKPWIGMFHTTRAYLTDETSPISSTLVCFLCHLSWVVHTCCLAPVVCLFVCIFVLCCCLFQVCLFICTITYRLLCSLFCHSLL